MASYEPTKAVWEHRRVRLMPCISGKKKNDANEMRATAALLSTISLVNEFGAEIAALSGFTLARRWRLHWSSYASCFTEVHLSDLDEGYDKRLHGSDIRPDGLLFASNGKSRWSALVEVKTGKHTLKDHVEQLKDYRKLAKHLGIDALITISNDVEFSLGKRGVHHCHHSWLSLAAIARKIQDAVADPDQERILAELIRFMEDSASEVLTQPSLGPMWGTFLDDPRQCSSPDLREIDRCWSELAKRTAIRLQGASIAAMAVPVVKNKLMREHRRTFGEVAEQLAAIWKVPVELVDRNDVAFFPHCVVRRRKASFGFAVPTHGLTARNALTRISRHINERDSDAGWEVTVKYDTKYREFTYPATECLDLGRTVELLEKQEDGVPSLRSSKITALWLHREILLPGKGGHQGARHAETIRDQAISVCRRGIDVYRYFYCLDALEVSSSGASSAVDGTQSDGTSVESATSDASNEGTLAQRVASCSRCSKKYVVPREYQKAIGRCSSCGGIVNVPPLPLIDTINDGLL